MVCPTSAFTLMVSMSIASATNSSPGYLPKRSLWVKTQGCAYTSCKRWCQSCATSVKHWIRFLLPEALQMSCWSPPALPKGFPAWAVCWQNNPIVSYTCHLISPNLTIPFPSAPNEKTKAENAAPVPTCTLLQVPPSFLQRLTWRLHGQRGHRELVGKAILRSWRHPFIQHSVGGSQVLLISWDHRHTSQGLCDAHRVGREAERSRQPERGQHDKTAEYL